MTIANQSLLEETRLSSLSLRKLTQLLKSRVVSRLFGRSTWLILWLTGTQSLPAGGGQACPPPCTPAPDKKAELRLESSSLASVSRLDAAELAQGIITGCHAS